MKTSLFLRAIILVLSVLVAVGVRAQDREAGYRIGPGDSIRITVFQNPDLTLETRVSEQGTITYPLVGSVRIGGLTLASAERVLAKALTDGGFIKQPQVNILPLQMRSSQVSVLGHVNHPGRFPLETFDTRISEMIAVAGGISATGGDFAILTGTRDGRQIRKEIDIPALFLGKNQQDDVTVAAGDVIYVPRAPMYYIYGEVQRPGSYRIERSMTVRQALVQGGGLTARGTERGLHIFRRETNGRFETISPNMNDAVAPDDVLYVGESIF